MKQNIERPFSLSETHFLPALQDAADGSLNNLRNQRRTFDEQMQRLHSVLETKRKIACGLYDEVDVNVEDADLYSDTTSLAPGSVATGPGAPKSNPASLRTRFAARSILAFLSFVTTFMAL